MPGASGAGAAADWMVLLLSPWVLALLGLCVGSFLNVVVHRLPAMNLRDWWEHDIADFALSDKRSWQATFGSGSEPPAELTVAGRAVKTRLQATTAVSLLRPRSRCPSCGHQLRAHENVPLLSWLMLKGRCSACGTRISLRYPLIEGGTALLFGGVAAVYGTSPFSVVACIAVSLLICMALVDLEFTLLPDSLTIPLIAVGLVAAAAKWSPVSWADAAAGALAGYGVLWALAVIWSIRHPHAMAEGDMKMLAGLGALLGWQALPGILLVAAGVGSVLGIGLIVFAKHRRETPIPFGPYLALAGILALLLRERFTGPVEELRPGLGL
jgi:leader peptidase (prepilin peptidase)/N-methyltransferase